MIVFRVLTPLLAGTPLRHRSSHSLQRTLVQILTMLLPCSLRRRQYKDIDTTCSYMEIPLLRQVCFERALHFFATVFRLPCILENMERRLHTGYDHKKKMLYDYIERSHFSFGDVISAGIWTGISTRMGQDFSRSLMFYDNNSQTSGHGVGE